jgi:hypothetical protein
LKNVFLSDYYKFEAKLPPNIRKKARETFQIFESTDQFVRGMQFKHIEGTLYSIRITLFYRALCNKIEDKAIWHWIGPHDEYMRRIRKRNS